LAGIHLRKAVDPAGRDAVRGAAVDDLRAIGAERVDQRHGLLGGLVRQAEHDQVDLAHDGEARSLVLALFWRDPFHGEAGDIADPAPDLEAGRAGLAVDEDGGLGFGLGCGLRPGGCLGGHGA
jgi:hypothetical protein